VHRTSGSLASLLTRRRRQGGMAMLEFVFILPVLLLVLFSIVEFGLLFGRWQTLTNAAREGARTAVVFRKDCDATALQTEVRTIVKDYASSMRHRWADHVRRDPLRYRRHAERGPGRLALHVPGGPRLLRHVAHHQPGGQVSDAQRRHRLISAAIRG
jgi:hypothetical protein